MSLNVTFNGFCYLEDNSLSNVNIRYQALFFPNGTASSSTTWNDVRTVENTGYFSCNLGDADWLDQDGTALNNSKVILVFWKGTPLGNDRNALCGVLEEWGATEITIDGSSVYTLNTQVKSNIAPILVWTLPSTGYVNTDYSTTNSSYDVHSWVYGTTTMYHWRTRYGQNIQLINTIVDTSYDWDDGSQDNDLPGTAAGTHQWANSGLYTVEAVIEDECGATTTGTKNIQIYNHAPVPDIICNEAVGQNITTPDTVVTFNYNGTDPDGVITGIEWVIEDATNTTYSGAKTDTVSHTNGTGTSWCSHTASSGAFTDYGTHNVSIIVHWDNGFGDQTIPYDEDFVQQKFTGPTVNFSQDPTEAEVGVPVEFTNTSTDVDRVGTAPPDCEEYEWRWDDDGTIETISDQLYSYKLNKTPGSTSCKVRLCADWQDGWDNQTECIEKDVRFKTLVTVSEEECYYNLNIVGTSSDGTVSGYSWTVSSGISDTGPWTQVWESPTGIEQNDKKICFTAVGYYKIDGYVYGTGATTTDDEILYVDEVCEEGEGGYEPITICEPDMDSDEFGLSHMKAHAMKPGMRATRDDSMDHPDIETDEIQPAHVEGRELIPFPKPRNL